jgi:signal transduction histidine kinase
MGMFSNSEALSRAGHELRTPLNAILGFGQLLALDQLNESQRHSVDQILAGGRHLLALIDDLLDLSRLPELSIEPVDAGEEIRQAVALCGPLAAERSLTVSVGIEDEPLLASADRRRLKQILLNLISNAIKYNRRRGSVSLRACSSDGEVQIEVIDTGRGLAEAELDRLFVPFERLSAARRGIEGNGLGLAVSNTLARAMGGAIDVVSTPGVGSVFTLRLPAAERRSMTRQVEDVERPARRVIVGVANRQDDAAAHHDRAVPVAAACGQ